MSLFDSLSKISEQIQSQRHLMKHSEDATILVSIQPFIRALGYDTQNLVEVFPQYNADAKSTGGEKVDYAIFREGNPIIFIEAKAANISLNESNWKQLYNYFNAEVGLRFGILANGVEYRFYTDLKADNIMDKEPFLTLDMLNLDEQLVAELEGFTKSSFDPERVVTGARKRVVARLLKQEMDNPSDEIARHFAKQLTTKRLTSDQLKSYAGLIREAWQGLVEADNGKPLPIPDNGDDNGQKPTPPPLPRKDIPVFGTYKGQRVEATLIVREHFRLQDKQNMQFSGALMNHREAMLKAKRTINSSAKDNISAWSFWHFLHPVTTKETPIKELFQNESLRTRLLSS